MNPEKEIAVWARVGGNQTESQEDRLAGMYMEQKQGTYLYLYLANCHPGLSLTFRTLADSKSQCAARLSALYFFKTGRKLLPPSPALPLAYTLPELLTERYHEAGKSLHFYEDTEGYSDLVEQTRLERELLSQIVMQKL